LENWKIYDENIGLMRVGTIVKDENKGWNYLTVCDMYEDVSNNYDEADFKLFPNAKENAKLICAAPDMLAALEFAAEQYQTYFADMPVAWQTVDNIIQETIAKAKG